MESWVEEQARVWFPHLFCAVKKTSNNLEAESGNEEVDEYKYEEIIIGFVMCSLLYPIKCNRLSKEYNYNKRDYCCLKYS